ncbi:hypothetical protein CsSME_00035646 [Camellia sinensis var. sinensis]
MDPLTYVKKCPNSQVMLKRLSSGSQIKSCSSPVWVILLVTALTWFGWFPFLLFDTDWMGREIYGGKPNEGHNYNRGVRIGAFDLMLNSGVLGITSEFMEKMCRK